MMYLLGIAAVAVIGVLGWNMTARAGYESAEFKVIETDGKFEIREYPDLMLASTSSKIDTQSRDGSFMKLFRYISGANQAEQKISMTTPVFMEKDDTEAQMGFVMPKEVAVADASGGRRNFVARFSEDQQVKMRMLAEKSRDGSLSAEEREEANSFERLSGLLGILQSRAWIVLRDAKR